MRPIPRISFGIIVLNGEPFTGYNLRALYPFAHQIIVVEGAVEAAAAIATPDGHSRDGTLETLYRFKAEEDPQDKVEIITRDGFWSEKDEMSRAYARRATGDYLWQVDIDEFYMPDDMQAVVDMLAEDPGITAVSFRQLTFWGGFDYIVNSWYLQDGAEIYHRVFKWGPGYTYATHRPPTVLDDRGLDMRTLKWVGGYELERRGIRLYHYSLVFPKQVRDKCEYYSRAPWAEESRRAKEWAEDSYFSLRRPFRVHNEYRFPAWLSRFNGRHPPEIERLRRDIVEGRVNVELRPTDDVERLLRSRSYRWKRAVLRLLGAARARWHRTPTPVRKALAPLTRALGLQRRLGG